MNIDQLREEAKKFPSQGGVEIGPWLEKYAGDVPPASNIVELGCWLGAGTAFLALGAMKSGAEIHVWDRFVCPNHEEQDKAANFGVKLERGEDTLPRVQAALKKFPVTIKFYKCSFKPGAAMASWGTREPIGLYVDDLTKVITLWEQAVHVFFDYFIPGKTILVLMDYHFDESMRDEGFAHWERYSVQKKYMQDMAQHFELIEDRLAGTTAAAFRYLG